MKTFVELVEEGSIGVDAIDDYIEQWHTSYNGNLSLPEFLGMTEEQYTQFVENPSSLKTMLHKCEPVYAKVKRIAKRIAAK